MRRSARGGLTSIVGATLMLLSITVIVPQAVSAATTCRVRNVTQETFGRSLIRMVEKAVDGDKLRVRRSCPGEVVFDVDVVIAGAGDGATLEGRDGDYVVLVERGARVTLRRLTIEGGERAGIRNQGVLRVTDSAVQDNGIGIVGKGGSRLRLVRSRVRHNGHAGIRSRSLATLTDSVVVDNGGSGILYSERIVLVRSAVRRNGDDGIDAIDDKSTFRMLDSTLASNAGAGVWTREGFILAVRSTIARNENSGIRAGSGVDMAGSGVVLRDSTVEGNASPFSGGGISIDVVSGSATLTLIRSVVRDNTAAGGGGGIAAVDTLVSLEDSHVTGNTAVVGGGLLVGGSRSSVTLDATSSVTGNTPDDCVGTPAC